MAKRENNDLWDNTWKLQNALFLSLIYLYDLGFISQKEKTDFEKKEIKFFKTFVKSMDFVKVVKVEYLDIEICFSFDTIEITKKKRFKENQKGHRPFTNYEIRNRG